MKKYVFTTFIISALWFSAQAQLEKVSVNSIADEQNPIISSDGQTLYFTRQYHPENVGGSRDPGDIWYAELQEDGNWGKAVNLKALNNSNFNSIIGFTDDGNKVFLNHHYLDNGRKPTTDGISMSERSGSEWSKPVSVNIPYFYNKSDHQSGSLHAGGQIMLVSLQSYDTKGAEDLYVLFRKADGSWSEPQNLGADINTPYQEMTPYLAPDGKTLFFASNGYEGFGSRDIFMSVRLDDSWKKWSNPKNLGARVNSEGTELYYRLPGEGGEFAYLTSTQNSDGLGDIKRIRIQPEEEEILDEPVVTELPAEEEVVVQHTPPAPQVTEVVEEAEETEEVPDVVLFKGIVQHKNTSQPIEATMSVRLLKSDSLMLESDAVVSEQGVYEFNLPAMQDYELIVSADGFIRERIKVILTQSENLDDSDVIVRNFEMTPIEVGSTVNLDNVLFDRGTSEMLPGSAESLDGVVEFLKENPEVEIEVAGHTDNRGRPDLNEILSLERAEAVKRYLLEQGIASGRISVKGYGGSRPIASNAIEEERMKNRRVEFTILKK
ncbi:MAG: OmpA family protein [Cyclobacteriaceae bacterium]